MRITMSNTPATQSPDYKIGVVLINRHWFAPTRCWPIPLTVSPTKPIPDYAAHQRRGRNASDLHIAMNKPVKSARFVHGGKSLDLALESNAVAGWQRIR